MKKTKTKIYIYIRNPCHHSQLNQVIKNNNNNFPSHSHDDIKFMGHGSQHIYRNADDAQYFKTTDPSSFSAATAGGTLLCSPPSLFSPTWTPSPTLLVVSFNTAEATRAAGTKSSCGFHFRMSAAATSCGAGPNPPDSPYNVSTPPSTALLLSSFLALPPPLFFSSLAPIFSPEYAT
mmetsp:Transcript_16569/g.29964  ORF Transcript_16569/g.29964 Transcript_16569/m.29964 type:complete len:177 (-) Transcript_16569:418-948(-)